uniref:50S ribosomal protein L21, chloroplastic n=2 Tax=Gelidium TaxID=2811 RepID=A0A411FT31_9FLOR|nr:ribosomal protein L21 [Gelidium coulteri]YP_009565300.1 ribosomal protein L21 [Gelidium sinicola]QBA96251.1 ribosomal protein L21 [Gelidium coulteri]QBA96651.1 ribosomal protein L21 [Gelidium sinicola]
MLYAIIEASGKQLWVEPGKFYDVNYTGGQPGDIIQFNRILLKHDKNKIEVGQPCIKSTCIKATILKHLKGRKITVFKMKPKKNQKVKQGHRQILTRLLIHSINNE